MAAQTVRAPDAPVGRVSFLGRFYGLGGVYAKTLRDSRVAIAVVAALIGLLVLGLGSFFASTYGPNRQQLVDLVASLPPAARGLFWGSGDMSSFQWLGGYVSIDLQLVYKLVPGLWSILVLSATLAVEARRGSLEFIAAAPSTKRRIAAQKVAGHVTAMALVVMIVAFVAWVTGQAFASEPADAISIGAALGWSLWMGVTGLMAGSIAFLLAPVVGRAGGVGIAGGLMFAAYVVDGFRSWVPAFGALANLSWFSWTADFNPLAGQWGWGALALLVAATAALLVVGVEVFARRDLDLGGRSDGRIRGIGALGLSGPLVRSFGEQLPRALAWGLGIGLYGLVIAASSRSFADSLADTPQLMVALQGLFPDYDLSTAAGLLQGAFMAFAYAIAGLAAATLVGGWAADETSGRLELLLTTPLARARWAIDGGAGVLVAIAVLTGVSALGIGLGVAAAGEDAVEPVVGTIALGLYASALTGVGVAIGGLWSTRVAGVAVAAIAVMTFLVDFLVPALNLPSWLRQLALSADLGQPMVGGWEPSGVVLSLALAVGGLAAGAWGMRRRDVAR